MDRVSLAAVIQAARTKIVERDFAGRDRNRGLLRLIEGVYECIVDEVLRCCECIIEATGAEVRGGYIVHT